MNRSKINRILADAVSFFQKHHFNLPPWAFWSREQWAGKGEECREIREKRLGWDITDFGTEDFAGTGLVLFTLRNGDASPDAAKNYCEKIMIAQKGQVTPWHYHKAKAEDIINRGGSDLIIELQKANSNGTLSEEDFTVQCDGITRKLKARESIKLTPGESIALGPYMSHTFYGGNGPVMIGEVSKTNDDCTDNFFRDKVGRFPAITEDEPPLFLLCSEYPPSL